MLKASYRMFYPLETLRFNINKFPHSFYLLRVVAEHIRMNNKKINSNIISVKTLLNSCPRIPKYSELKQKKTSERIITPFEKNMSAIKAFKWSYCGSKGVKVKKYKNFREFSNRFVKIQNLNWPKHKKSNNSLIIY